MEPSTPRPTAVRRLLLPPGPEVESLEYDLLQRYTAATRLLERMLSDAGDSVRILELGPNYLNPLPLFLDRNCVRLTRADVNPVSADPDFILLGEDGELPFADDSFDAVIALDVLEHMPAERRPGFLAESLRVARHGAIFACPNGVPEVVEAEMQVNEAYRQRHGKDHPWLEEHRRFGIPEEAAIVAALRALDLPHAVVDNAPLATWLPMVLLSENLFERQAPPRAQQRLNEFARCHAGGSIPYRKFYVCVKRFDATTALEPPGERRATPGRPTLEWATAAAADALAAIEEERRNERVAVQSTRARLEGEIENTRQEAARLKSELDEMVTHLQGIIAIREEELRVAVRRHYSLNAYLSALRESRNGKLLALSGAAVHAVRSRRFDEGALIPWHHLERDEAAGAGAWRVTGPDAYFIVPCHLPAGWLRLRLHLASAHIGRAEITFDTCAAEDEVVLREHLAVHGRVDRDGFVYLPRPVVAMRFYPLDVTGKFTLERLEVTALSSLAALAEAARAKVALLRGHGLLARSFLNALRMVVRGQFGELARKLHGGLVYPGRERLAFSGAADDEPSTPAPFAPAGFVRMEARKLDIVYVLRSAGLCGGVKVVLEHASRLYARGHRVWVYYLEGSPSWFRWRVPTRRFPDIASLRQALAGFRGIKVATWYETAPWVAESLRDGDRGYYLVQDIEESYGETREQAAAALHTYSLGLRAITEGLWVRQQLRERFGVDSVFVSIGLDHDLFQPRMVLREPQRILTQARTWSGGVSAGAKLKGWDTARDVILRCHTLEPRTTLTTFSIENTPTFPAALTHQHEQSPSDDRLAELYSQAGLYLLTSRHEGFGLTAAEAMACGCSVVATRAQGNEEFCLDGVTALTADADDVERLAQHCLRLEHDREFAAELSHNARHFIRQYTWERVVDRLEREFLGEQATEVVIAAPAPTEAETETPPAREDRIGADLVLPPVPTATPTMPSDPWEASQPPGATCRRGGEYPDLRLRGSTFVDWSVIIPTIGHAELVGHCISSCRRFIPDGTAVQFIVVDDGSSDPAVLQSLRRAAREHDFQLLFNRQNLGFSATVNRGLRKARGRNVVLCNNDILFFRPWIEPLEELFKTDPHIGIIGARLLYPDGTIQHAGMEKAPGSLNWYHSYGKMRGEHPPANATRYAWAVTGALFTIRRAVLERLGGFSTAYATAYEDLDYCLYAWANGVRVAYHGGVTAYHLEGHTRGATEAQKGERPLWAAREHAGRGYFEKKWDFLRHVEDYRAVLALMERGPAELPVFAARS